MQGIVNHWQCTIFNFIFRYMKTRRNRAPFVRKKQHENLPPRKSTAVGITLSEPIVWFKIKNEHPSWSIIHFLLIYTLALLLFVLSRMNLTYHSHSNLSFIRNYIAGGEQSLAALPLHIYMYGTCRVHYMRDDDRTNTSMQKPPIQDNGFDSICIIHRWGNPLKDFAYGTAPLERICSIKN